MARTYETYRDAMINRIKTLYGDRYQSFHDASTGMMLIELMSFVASTIEDYTDNVQSQLYNDTVTDTNHAYAIAKSRGYKIRPAGASYGEQQFTITVADLNDANFIVHQKTTLSADDGTTFQLVEPIDFSIGSQSKALKLNYDERDITYENGNYTIRKTGKIVAGVEKTTTFTVGNPQPFLELYFPTQDNIIEIVSVTDSLGNEWLEVDYLAQEVILEDVPNLDSDSNNVYSLLTSRAVARRFVRDFDIFRRSYKLVFGNGQNLSRNQYIATPLDLLIQNSQSGLALDSSITSPSTYINNPTLGLTPSNTTLTVVYRTTTDTTSVLQPNTITSISNLLYSFKDSSMTSVTRQAVLDSLLTFNVSSVANGSYNPTLGMILDYGRQIAATQGRAVTVSDYVAMAYTLPAQFGRVYRASGYYDKTLDAIKLAIVTRNNDQVTVPTESLIENLQVYLNHYKTITDRVIVEEGTIVDIQIVYQITSTADSAVGLLQHCNTALRDIYNADYFYLGRPLVISEIIRTLQGVPGVRSVVAVDILSKSAEYPNIDGWIDNNMVIGPANVIFNVRDPYLDIKGSIAS